MNPLMPPTPKRVYGTPNRLDPVPHVLREVGWWMAQMKDWSVDDWFEFHAGLTDLFDSIAAKHETR